MISVVVPVYNAEQYLQRCIESVINQTYKNLELILVNDGSTDNSESICKEYAKLDERIAYIFQENKGVDSARKMGIKCAQGEYVSFVDADDYIEHSFYQSIMEKTEGKNADVILFNILEESDNDSKIIRNAIPEGFYTYEAMNEIVFPIMMSNGTFFNFGIIPTVYSKLFKTDFLEKTTIYTNDCVSFGEDAAFVFQALIHAKQIEVVDQAFYHYVKKKSDSLSWKQQSEESIIALQGLLESGFADAGKLDIMEKQLHEYMTFVRLLKVPGTVPGVEAFFSQSDIRIALYGAGGFGQAIFHEYHDQISLWVDRDYGKYDFLDGEVVSIDALLEKSDHYDVIYIAIINESLCEQIKTDLVKKGIDKEIRYFEIYPDDQDMYGIWSRNK